MELIIEEINERICYIISHSEMITAYFVYLV